MSIERRARLATTICIVAFLIGISGVADALPWNGGMTKYEIIIALTWVGWGALLALFVWYAWACWRRRD